MSGISDEEKWECYLCGHEFDLEQPAFGWLGNYHMLCHRCANNVYFSPKSKFHRVMTYHYLVGDTRKDSLSS